MNNIEFLNELKFFNENPAQTELIDRSLLFGLFFIESISFAILFSFIKPAETIALISLSLCVASIIGSFIYINKKNKRYEAFQHVKYAGHPADLFGDLTNPEMAEYLPDLKQELVSYSGIRGYVAVGICARLNDSVLREQRLKRNEAKKIIEEIETIQKRTE